MAEKIPVLIQMRHTPELSAAMVADTLEPTTVESITVPGFSLDQSYTPVKVPDRKPREQIDHLEVGRLYTFDPRPEVSTYLIRGEVEDEDALERLADAVAADPNCVGVFSDPRISAIAVCPANPVGSDEDVETRLQTATLRGRGMDGSNVLVAIVDTGVNLQHLSDRGKNPGFDAEKSWTPVSGLVPGNMPVDHGTMCAFDACIAAPNCTLLDYALLMSQTPGGSAMDGFLSDAVKAYNKLLSLLIDGPEPAPPLVVSNSWGMFHPSWDFEPGHPGNYSDNPDHPFNIIVESLEDAGADILFAAGNCGPTCPDGRCQGVTHRPIYGANSHAGVLCVGAVTVDKVLLGYSSQGPGRLERDKPDLCAYSHFEGSGVYAADGGTSAACPVAAGVVAAIRSVYPPSAITPAQLGNTLRRGCEDLGQIGFDYGHGFGVIDVPGTLRILDGGRVRELKLGEVAAGALKENGDTVMFRLNIGEALNLELDGPQGADFDIYVRKGEQPTTTEYDHRGYTSSADEKIRIQPVEPGEYFIMVRSYRGVGDFSLKAVLG
jgi:subtilisin family serine protease